MKRRNKLTAALLIMAMLFCNCMPALADDVNTDVPPVQDENPDVPPVQDEETDVPDQDDSIEELKPESVIIMPEARTVTYNGLGRTIKVTEVEGSVGEVTYQYYTDKNCTTLVTKENSGAKAHGLYPSDPGIYYVVATVAADDNYRETVSKPAKLTIKPRVVGNFKVENKMDGVKISWDKVEEADGYILYRRYDGSDNQVLQTLTKNSTLSFKDTTATAGAKYCYNIVSYSNDENTKIKSSKRNSASGILLIRPEVTNVYSGVKLSWKYIDNSNVKGFYVYRKVSGESNYKKVATIKELKKNITWTDKNVSNGKTVYYYVQAYYGTSNSTVKKSVNRIFYRLTRPTGKREGSYVKWDRNSKADGYEVFIDGLGSSFDDTKVITSNKTLKLKYESGQVDCFKVRSYKKIDGKTYYSAWSKEIAPFDSSVFK